MTARRKRIRGCRESTILSIFHYSFAIEGGRDYREAADRHRKRELTGMLAKHIAIP
jgi:hypothetical protein